MTGLLKGPLALQGSLTLRLDVLYSGGLEVIIWNLGALTVGTQNH